MKKSLFAIPLIGMLFLSLTSCNLFNSPNKPTSTVSNKEKIETVIETIKNQDDLIVRDENAKKTILKKGDYYHYLDPNDDFYYYNNNFYLKTSSGFEETKLSYTDKVSKIDYFDDFLDDLYDIKLDEKDKTVYGRNEMPKVISNDYYLFSNQNFVLKVYNKEQEYNIKYQNVSDDFDKTKLKNIEDREDDNFDFNLTLYSTMSDYAFESKNYLNCETSTTEVLETMIEMENDKYTGFLKTRAELSGHVRATLEYNEKDYNGEDYYELYSEKDETITFYSLDGEETLKINGRVYINKTIDIKKRGFFNLNSTGDKVLYNESEEILSHTIIKFVSDDLIFTFEISGKGTSMNSYTEDVLGTNSFGKHLTVKYQIEDTVKYGLETKNSFPVSTTINKKETKSELITTTESATFFNSTDGKSSYNSTTKMITYIN